MEESEEECTGPNMNGRPKTICMLTYGYFPLASGGAENQCRLQSHELARRGYRCLVLTARIRKSSPIHEMEGGCEIFRLAAAQPFVDVLLSTKTWLSNNVPGGNPASHQAEAHNVVEENQANAYARVVRWFNSLFYLLGASLFLFRHRHSVDILHTHVASWNAGFAGWIGNILGIPVLCKAAYLPAFYEFDRSIPFHATWQHWRKRIRYIALTQEMADDIADNGVPRDRIHIIPNGVSIPDDITPVETNHSVLYVGNFTQGAAHKGFDVLISAWSMVNRESPGACLVIAGGGNNRIWRDMAEALGCGSSIRFEGHISDMASCYREAALFVLPSRGEGISNALLEANSYGIPSVATDIPGNREIIIHERTGLLVPVDDTKALADSILKLLRDNGLREQMGKAARCRITKKYSIATVVDRLCDVYATMTSKPK